MSTAPHLQAFLADLERAGELQRVRVPVNPVLEVTEVCDRVVRRSGPALLFEQPVGSSIPLVINVFGTERRMQMALGVGDIEEVAADIEDLLRLQPPRGLREMLGALPKLDVLRKAAPTEVKRGACQEVTAEPDVGVLPILQCWPDDAGRYITYPLVFTKDPETGQRNVGTYRLQVVDGRTLLMHWQTHKGGAEHWRAHQRLGKPMEVAIVIGADPVTLYAGTAPLPDRMDELMFAGFLRKQSVELVKCKTIDQEVPAEAEIVLEGVVQPGELATEGPFGDHTGFYSMPEQYPVFHLNTITHRRNPVYHTIVVGPPPKEDYWLGYASVRIFLPMLKMQLPEIVDMHMPPEGIFNNLAVISIKKKYPGHAFKVMHALWGLGQMMFTKMLIIVDDWVNVHDMQEVIFVLGNHIDPARDVQIVKGPVDSLNHAAPLLDLGSKIGFDATAKWKSEGFDRPWPHYIKMSPAVQAKVDVLWGSLGLK